MVDSDNQEASRPQTLEELHERACQMVSSVRLAYISLFNDNRPAVRGHIQKTLETMGEADPVSYMNSYSGKTYYDYNQAVYRDLDQHVVSIALSKARETQEQLKILTVFYALAESTLRPVIEMEYLSAAEFIATLADETFKRHEKIATIGQYDPEIRTSNMSYLMDTVENLSEADEVFRKQKETLKTVFPFNTAATAYRDAEQLSQMLSQLTELRANIIVSGLHQIETVCSTAVNMLCYMAALPDDADLSAPILTPYHSFIRNVITLSDQQSVILKGHIVAVNTAYDNPSYYAEGEYQLLPLDRAP